MSAYSALVLSRNPAIYLRCGESSGTAMVDSGPNGLHGVYQGTPTLGVPGAIVGDPNTGFAIDGGASNYATVASNALINLTDNFTLELWFRRFVGSVAGRLLDGAGGLNPYDFSYLTDGTLRWGKLGVATIVASTRIIPENVWAHLVATVAGTDFKLYIDGFDRTGVVTPLALGVPAGMLIGTSLAQWAKGSLDEIAMYPTVLTAAQVRQSYLAGRAMQDRQDFGAIYVGAGL